MEVINLFPVPAVDDGANHVFVSVGHGQMMTDAMRPLGLSMWQLTAARPMYDAGGRLFVDVTEALASPASRAGLLDVLGRGDPLMRDALQTIIDRDFIRPLPNEAPVDPPLGLPPTGLIEADPAIVSGHLLITAPARDSRSLTSQNLYWRLRTAFYLHVPGVVRFYDTDSLPRLVEDQGLTVVECNGEPARVSLSARA
ncbi:MAG: hypothetical protein ACR2LQ_10645 [Acidimicrobiales bacterium]